MPERPGGIVPSDMDPYVEEVERLRHFLQWCRDEHVDPRSVVEGRVLVDVPPHLWPTKAAREAVVRRARRTRNHHRRVT